jgi:hypothetical protein
MKKFASNVNFSCFKHVPRLIGVYIFKAILIDDSDKYSEIGWG